MGQEVCTRNQERSHQVHEIGSPETSPQTIERSQEHRQANAVLGILSPPHTWTGVGIQGIIRGKELAVADDIIAP
jgi:hypothetical protein